MSTISKLCVMPARQFTVSFAQSGTFALPHIRHSNQSNAKEPASPTRNSRTKPWTEKQNDKIPEFNFGSWTSFSLVEKSMFADSG